MASSKWKAKMNANRRLEHVARKPVATGRRRNEKAIRSIRKAAERTDKDGLW